jgi:methylmalonyl-CoA epimerase
MFAIDHLGVAVRSLQQAAEFYRKLGAEVLGEELVEQEKVRVAMVPLGGSRIELLEATSEDSPVARFIARRGEGLHHVALQVENLAQKVEDLKRSGVRLVTDEIQVGAGGHLYVFIHPSSAGGVLLELCQDPPRGI